MEKLLIDNACEALPLFPLPRVVLMPGALLPLHVFEPRYRELVAWSLSHERLIGVATLRSGYQVDYHGSPPIHRPVGIGRIVSYQPLPDGRSNVVLRHVTSGLVAEEIASERGFRLGRVELVPDDTSGLSRAAAALRALVLQIGCASDETALEARRIAELCDREMVDELGRRLIEDTDDRLRYLGATPATRARLVHQRMAEMLSVHGEASIEA